MLQNIFIFISILAAAAFQVSFLPHFFSPENVPDFLLMVAIFWATKLEFSKILIWVILAGIILDMSYLAPLGLNVFSFVLVIFISSFLFGRIFVAHGVWKFLTMFSLVIIGTLLNDWVLAIFNWATAANPLHYSWSLFLGKNIFIKILFNLITFGLIYWPLMRIYKHFSLYYSRTRVLK